MQPWDVIVVGAGPAGCAAAYDLATNGRSVLLLDRCDFPRPKACAGGVTTTSRQVPPSPAAFADYSAPPNPYPVAAPAPTAILVVLPGAGASASDPKLWRGQGIDVVTPPPTV